MIGLTHRIGCRPAFDSPDVHPLRESGLVWSCRDQCRRLLREIVRMTAGGRRRRASLPGPGIAPSVRAPLDGAGHAGHAGHAGARRQRTAGAAPRKAVPRLPPRRCVAPRLQADALSSRRIAGRCPQFPPAQRVGCQGRTARPAPVAGRGLRAQGSGLGFWALGLV